MTIRLRPATAADFTARGRAVPEVFLGFAAERDGEVVGYGLVVWDHEGRAWGAFDRFGDVPRFLMHRLARRVIAALREAGEPAIYAICDTRIPRAEEWLRRLGFTPTPDRVGEEIVFACRA